MINKNHKIKVGLIVTMSEDPWPDRWVLLIESFIKPAKEMLESLGFEVISYGKLCRNINDAREQGVYLRDKNIDVLVNHVGGWTYANDSVEVAKIVNVPVIVWPSYSKESVGIAGGAIVRGSHDELNIKTYMVYGDYNDKELQNEISILIRGIAGVTKLKGLRYGVGGTRSMGMIAAQPDPSQWSRDFGIDVDGFEQVLLVEKAKEYSDNKVNEFYKWLDKEFGGIEVKKEVMEAQIRMYFALRDYIIKREYDFISVKCLPELPYVYTTFCLAISLLNDTSNDGFGNKNPFVVACEADSNGALTMQILKNISNNTTLFTDVNYIDYEKRLVTLANCGSQPTDFASSRKCVRWVKEGYVGHDFKLGCACPRYIGKEGVMTLSRLTRVNGKYHMLISTGKSLYLNLNPEEEPGSIQHPKLFLNLDCDLRNFVKSLRTNHIHLVFGNYEEELKIVCEILGIIPVIPN